MKLCVFQGTFNPIHNAHLRVADYVLKKYDFDKLLFIPAYKPPHKDYDDDLSLHRLNMVKLAVESFNNPKIEVSDIEYKRGGKSYTYLTICELYEKYEIEGKIHFIIGTDAFKDIETWYETDKLKKLVKFIVFKRENNFSPLSYNNLKDKGYDFIFDDLEFEDISSTRIRQIVKNGENAHGLTNKRVEEYIEKNGLYET